jgi:hypothetical protein
MSLCKITRGSRELRKKDSAFKKILDEYPGWHRILEGGQHESESPADGE